MNWLLLFLFIDLVMIQLIKSQEIRFEMPGKDDIAIEFNAETTFGELKKALQNEKFINNPTDFDFLLDGQSLELEDNEEIFNNGRLIDSIEVRVKYYITARKWLKDNNINQRECINALNNLNKEILHYCINADLSHFMDKLKSKFIQSAKEVDLNTVELLLDCCVQTNLQDYAVSALIYAAAVGHENIAQLLLNKGVAINLASADSMGDTALIMAAKGGHANIVQLLLEKGAAIDLKNPNGDTALMIAADTGCLTSLKIVQLLLDKHAAMDVQDKINGFTALMNAIWRGDENIVQLLLDKGAAIDLQCPTSGFNALMLATAKGDENIVQLLLAKGAATDLETKDGYILGRGLTALELAKNQNIIRMLSGEKNLAKARRLLNRY